MNHYNLQFYLFLITLFLCVYSCKERASIAKEDSNSTEIHSNTAKIRIDKYNNIYGNSGKQYLIGSNDKKVVLPRYFIVNSLKYSNLLQDRDGVLFASFNVKMERDTPVTNIIFHDLQPLPDGSLRASDQYYDFAKTCPIDCDDSYTNTGFLSGPVDGTEAAIRIENYNNIYGQDMQTIRYMKSTDGQDSILIPRYYSFNVSDMQGLLDALEENTQQYFYVSMGAVQKANSDGQNLANTFVSDLIFHCDRPGSTGFLEAPEAISDKFFDVTRPCPDSCPESDNPSLTQK